MKITELQSLRTSDPKTYKDQLLRNQENILARKEEESIFISALDVKALEQKIDAQAEMSPAEYPLLGIPFAVKDNIDVLGFPTTAACPEFAYTPPKSAFVVQLLEAAGAICIGKTNMDQFATGLVGTRSPYGTAKNYFNPDYIPGGSSSGSASAITAGYVPFSLGTDTAGSGRIPAAFQSLVGIKPTKGVISTTGLVPACRSLDCISIFALDLQEACTVFRVTSQYDEKDVYSRRNSQYIDEEEIKIGIPLQSNLKFFGNTAYEEAYRSLLERMKQCGYNMQEIDFTPMFEAATLLYNGPWLAERYHAVGEFIQHNPKSVFPVTKDIILKGRDLSAQVYFDAEYKLKNYQKVFDEYAREFSFFLMPTAGTIYKIDEVNAEPVTLNSNLGYYTNFINLLDCAAIALPVTITDNNLPFGVTVFAPAFNDVNLLKLGKSLHSKGLLNRKDEEAYIDLAVCGAHRRSGSLNYQLIEINAVYKETTYTSEDYRLFALEHLSPIRPGLIRDSDKGNKIEVEIWKVPATKLGRFISRISAPLCFGKITLKNGAEVLSFLCERYALKNAREITHLGSWNRYLQ